MTHDALNALQRGEPRWILGMMSGTSLDGVDAALIETNGEMVLSMGLADCMPYSREDRALLRAALTCAAEMDRPSEVWPAEIRAASDMLTDKHIQAVFALTERKNAAKPTLVGFHGQTIVHRPPHSLGALGWTLQIGDPQRLADAIGLPVVADFRSADMQAGGQGAPLVPLFHRALLQNEPEEQSVAMLNIGGVANITWLGSGAGGDRAIVAFDTGPGNALLDDWMLKVAGQRFDRDGQLARSGHVHQEIIDDVLARPYFAQKPPKSLDRDDFQISLADLSPADGAATLTALTVQTIAQALQHLPSAPVKVYVCGGGRHNATMMQGLADSLVCNVLPVEDIGLRGDSLEAEVFAWLAARQIRGLPTSIPETTGVPLPTCGGQLFMPSIKA